MLGYRGEYICVHVCLACLYPAITEPFKLGICQICVILSDLWSFFSKAKLSATKLQPLGFSPSAEILRSFWKLCEYRLTAAGEYYAALLLAFTKDLLTFFMGD